MFLASFFLIFRLQIRIKPGQQTKREKLGYCPNREFAAVVFNMTPVFLRLDAKNVAVLIF
jgi:hypothetical protein